MVLVLPNNLRVLRDAKHWTQGELAERMGTTRSQYVKLESGARRLHSHWITRAAEALDVDEGAIVGRRERLVDDVADTDDLLELDAALATLIEARPGLKVACVLLPNDLDTALLRWISAQPGPRPTKPQAIRGLLKRWLKNQGLLVESGG